MTFRAIFALTLLLAATAAAARRDGPFVLTDQSTGLPILSCSVPKGHLPGGKVIWIRNPSQPVRYYAIATDPTTGFKMILGSTLTLQPRNPYTPLARAADITVPNQVAQRLADEIVGLYGLKNLRVVGATLSPFAPNVSKPLVDKAVADARRSLVPLTMCNYGLLRLRYTGLLNGRPRVVNCFAPYGLMEFGGASSLGQMTHIDSCCTTLQDENAGIARMVAFARTRQICPAFESFCTRIIQKNTQIMINSLNECLDIFLQTAGENSRRISAANARWCDAIRGEERVVNPSTGRATFISTQYDHCRLGANGETLYWNGDGAAAGFNPNESAAFNHTTWSAPRKAH